ncbi:MAG TPA: TetR/AcrR family transcriptional regulator [Hellea balneolensis]|uniref:TetR/AcrR family transcriptional regulator n=1 Tax=Hellea balneolensis TaxID=287478 RepID=A0A7C5QPF0_9PROT|nr:TetR/AcrR family transcriptional regulator [Hellea balneolensis]
MDVKTTHIAPKNPVGRPRNLDLDAKILDTAQDILIQEGYANFSMSKVAKLSGISRPTIRLRWANTDELFAAIVKRALSTDLLLEQARNNPDITMRETILLVLQDMIVLLSDPSMRRLFASIIAAARYSKPMGALSQYILKRRGIVLRDLVVQGIENGEFSPDINVEIALDGLIGPIQYRQLIIGMPMAPEEAVDVVNMVFGPE